MSFECESVCVCVVISLTELLHTVAHKLLLLLLIGDGVALQLTCLEWRCAESFVYFHKNSHTSTSFSTAAFTLLFLQGNKLLITLPVIFCSSLHYRLVYPMYNSYLRPQCQVLVLQLLQLTPQTLQLAECRRGGGPPRRQRLPQRRGHTGVSLALLRGVGHHPQQLILLAELMLQLVDLANGEGLDRLINLQICVLLMKYSMCGHVKPRKTGGTSTSTAALITITDYIFSFLHKEELTSAIFII